MFGAATVTTVGCTGDPTTRAVRGPGALGGHAHRGRHGRRPRPRVREHAATPDSVPPDGRSRRRPARGIWRRGADRSDGADARAGARRRRGSARAVARDGRPDRRRLDPGARPRGDHRMDPDAGHRPDREHRTGDGIPGHDRRRGRDRPLPAGRRRLHPCRAQAASLRDVARRAPRHLSGGCAIVRPRTRRPRPRGPAGRAGVLEPAIHSGLRPRGPVPATRARLPRSAAPASRRRGDRRGIRRHHARDPRARTRRPAGGARPILPMALPHPPNLALGESLLAVGGARRRCAPAHRAGGWCRHARDRPGTRWNARDR